MRLLQFSIFCALMVSQATISLHAQTNPLPVIALWPEGAPGALGKEPKDIPTLTVYLPQPGLATGAAMVICPGGGYGVLSPHVGGEFALWLNEQGIAGFVLKYRLGPSGYRHPILLQDAARAARLVRAKAAEWKVDPKRVGIMGSSAGGHLASTLLTHFDHGNSAASDSIDQQSSRPDLGIICYPVVTMGEFTHAESKKNLLGENPPPDLVRELSNELHVTKETPPCFIWHTLKTKLFPWKTVFNLQQPSAERACRSNFTFMKRVATVWVWASE